MRPAASLAPALLFFLLFFLMLVLMVRKRIAGIPAVVSRPGTVVEAPVAFFF